MSPESSLNLQGGRFQKGQSGNPKGKPKGARNRTTLIAQTLLDGQAEALVGKVVQLALDGDLTCLRICLERLVPPKKDAPIEIDLPDISAVADIPKLFSVKINWKPPEHIAGLCGLSIRVVRVVNRRQSSAKGSPLPRPGP